MAATLAFIVCSLAPVVGVILPLVAWIECDRQVATRAAYALSILALLLGLGSAVALWLLLRTKDAEGWAVFFVAPYLIGGSFGAIVLAGIALQLTKLPAPSGEEWLAETLAARQMRLGMPQPNPGSYACRACGYLNLRRDRCQSCGAELSPRL